MKDVQFHALRNSLDHFTSEEVLKWCVFNYLNHQQTCTPARCLELTLVFQPKLLDVSDLILMAAHVNGNHWCLAVSHYID